MFAASCSRQKRSAAVGSAWTDDGFTSVCKDAAVAVDYVGFKEEREGAKKSTSHDRDKLVLLQIAAEVSSPKPSPRAGSQVLLARTAAAAAGASLALTAAGTPAVSGETGAVKRKCRNGTHNTRSEFVALNDREWNIPTYLQQVASTTARSLSESSICKEEEHSALPICNSVGGQHPGSPVCLGDTQLSKNEKFYTAACAPTTHVAPRNSPSAARVESAIPPTGRIALSISPTTVHRAISSTRTRSNNTGCTGGETPKTVLPWHASRSTGLLTGDPFSRPPVVPVQLLVEGFPSSVPCVSGPLEIAAAARVLSATSIACTEPVSWSSSKGRLAAVAARESAPTPFPLLQEESHCCASFPKSKAATPASAPKTGDYGRKHAQCFATETDRGHACTTQQLVPSIHEQQELAAAVKPHHENKKVQQRAIRSLQVAKEQQREAQLGGRQKQAKTKSPDKEATLRHLRQDSISPGPRCGNNVVTSVRAAAGSTEKGAAAAAALQQSGRRDEKCQAGALPSAIAEQSACCDDTATARSKDRIITQPPAPCCSLAGSPSRGVLGRVRWSPQRTQMHRAGTSDLAKALKITSNPSACHCIPERRRLQQANQCQQLQAEQYPVPMQGQLICHTQPHFPGETRSQSPPHSVQQQRQLQQRLYQQQQKPLHVPRQQCLPHQRQQKLHEMQQSTPRGHSQGCFPAQSARAVPLRQHQNGNGTFAPAACCYTSAHFRNINSSSGLSSPSHCLSRALKSPEANAAFQPSSRKGYPLLSRTQCLSFPPSADATSSLSVGSARHQPARPATVENLAGSSTQQRKSPFLASLSPEGSPSRMGGCFAPRCPHNRSSPLQQQQQHFTVPTGSQQRSLGCASDTSPAVKGPPNQTKKKRSNRSTRTRKAHTVAFTASGGSPVSQLHTPQLENCQKHQQVQQVIPHRQQLQEHLQNAQTPTSQGGHQQHNKCQPQQQQGQVQQLCVQQQPFAKGVSCVTQRALENEDVRSTARTGLRWLKWKRKNSSGKSPHDVGAER